MFDLRYSELEHRVEQLMVGGNVDDLMLGQRLVNLRRLLFPTRASQKSSTHESRP
jgi:hypothetical protein